MFFCVSMYNSEEAVKRKQSWLIRAAACDRSSINMCSDWLFVLINSVHTAEEKQEVIHCLTWVNPESRWSMNSLQRGSWAQVYGWGWGWQPWIWSQPLNQRFFRLKLSVDYCSAGLVKAPIIDRQILGAVELKLQVLCTGAVGGAFIQLCVTCSEERQILWCTAVGGASVSGSFLRCRKWDTSVEHVWGFNLQNKEKTVGVTHCNSPPQPPAHTALLYVYHLAHTASL